MSKARLIALLLAEMAATVVVLGGLLFGAAGTWAWPSAWAYLGVFLILGLGVSLWLADADPGLLRERLASPYQKGQKGFDRVFLSLVMVVYLGWTVLMGLDARRFGWSQVPMALQVLGAALIAASYLGIAWVFATNSFAAPVIRIQAERGQRVIDTGPYAWVRHPMYAFAALQFVGGPLMLGSWWGLVVVPPFYLGLAWRIFGEERTLSEALAGYDDYARRVRWRLLPGVW
ncbi:isoprenylcysteine carboxylmethyltransferase family protein [Phenylobacterium sp.]|jgi:protein-S-isoprenylcysteine O-methyltransferase Ste14|uniref:methyltransferase family protein n=1 Tax=Phenylobacterium sp. TaxID=1871053 RepID=UPI002F3ED13E